MNYGGCGLCNIHTGWKEMPVSTRKHLLYSVETLLCAVLCHEAFLRCHLAAEQGHRLDGDDAVAARALALIIALDPWLITHREIRRLNRGVGSGLAIIHSWFKLGIMSRPLRIELSGGLYHVTSRGDRREAIYRDDQDREDWLVVLGEVCSRFNWRCHLWCEMTSHYYFVVETPDANLSKGMRQLNGVYTQRTNRRHGLVGHLFQGRFKAILVERDAYLLELARYVVLNPVRAGMLQEAGDWPWSNYRAMVGQAPAPPPGWRPTGFWASSQENVPARKPATPIS